MSLVEESLNEAVRNIINLIIDSDANSGFAIKAEDKGGRPTAPHATVKTMTIASVGIEEDLLTDRGGDPDIDSKRSGYREVMFSINFYFAKAMDNGEQVKIGLVRNSILEILQAAELGLATRSEVRDLSEVLENGWEERAQFDFVLSAIGTDVDIITSIATMSISGDFQTRGISIPVTIEV